MQHRSKKIKKSFFIILVVLIVLSGSSAIYLGNYYHSVDVEKYMTSSSEVTIKKFDKGWFFDGAGEEKALIFYPGAKVATEAYAPLMYQLAESGIDCFLVEGILFQPGGIRLYHCGKATQPRQCADVVLSPPAAADNTYFFLRFFLF